MIRLSGEINDITIDGVSVATEPEVDSKVLADRASTGQRKNYLINGNFDMWQRGTSPTVANGGYVADRWIIGYAGTAPSVALHNTVFDANVNKLIINGTSGNTISQIQQRIESTSCRRFAVGAEVTLSFKVHFTVNATRSFSLYIRNATVKDNFTSTENSILVPIASVPSGSIVSATFTIPSDNFRLGAEIVISVDGGVTVGSAVLFSEVKLEDGSVATNGWHPYDGEFGGEVQACQRYYETIPYVTQPTVSLYSNAWANGGKSTTYFKTTKRTIPTIVGRTYLNCTMVAESTTVDTAYSAVTGTSSSSSSGISAFSASSEL